MPVRQTKEVVWFSVSDAVGVADSLDGAVEIVKEQLGVDLAGRECADVLGGVLQQCMAVDLGGAGPSAVC